jgi:hypothetical protein
MSLTLIESLIENLLDEDVFSDLVNKYPKLKAQLETAKNQGVPVKYLGWLAKILGSASEPVEDIIPLLKTFEKKKEALKSKFGGNAADINAYKTAQELSSKLEQLYDPEKEKKKAGFKAAAGVKESEKLYEDNEWILIMPESTAESCKWGAGTTWCTARTQSQNLFLSYVARPESDIILFYLIQKGEDPRENPNSKISIGFINGEPQFDGDYGGVTVNAANNAIDEVKFYEILGDARGSKILELMKQKSAQISGQHPAKTELKVLVSNPTELAQKIDSFKNMDEKEDFIAMASEQVESPESLRVLISKSREPYDAALTALDRYEDGSSPPKELIEVIYNTLGEEFFYAKTSISYQRNDALLKKVAGFKSTPENIIIGIINFMEQSDFKQTAEQHSILKIIAFSSKLSDRIVSMIFNPSELDDDYSVLRNLIVNPDLPLESTWKLVKYLNDSFYSTGIDDIAQRRRQLLGDLAEKTQHPVILQFLTQQGLQDPDRNYMMLSYISTNIHTHPSTVKQLFNRIWKSQGSSYAEYILASMARSPNTPADILLTLARVTDSQNYTIDAIRNPGIGVENLRKMAESSVVGDREIAAMNPATPDDVLLKLLYDPAKEVQLALVIGRNKKYPPAVKQAILTDPKFAKYVNLVR